MLKICEFHGISWDNAEYVGGCPMCRLNKMIGDDYAKISGLKVRVRELEEEVQRRAEELAEKEK